MERDCRATDRVERVISAAADWFRHFNESVGVSPAAAFPLAKPEPKVFDSSYKPGPIFRDAKPEPVLTSHTEGSAADCREIDDDDGDWIYVYKTGINISGGLDRDTARRVIEEQARVIEELKGKPAAQRERDRVRVSVNELRECLGGVYNDGLLRLLRERGVEVEDSE